MMQPLTQSLFTTRKSLFLDNEVTGVLHRKNFTKTLETLISKLTPTKESCHVKNILGQTPLHMAHLSQELLLTLLKERMNALDTHENDHDFHEMDMDTDIPLSDYNFGLDFLGRNVLGECIHPNPLASRKLDFFDKERLLNRY